MMNIDDKYLKLINKLIYDKKKSICGIIRDLRITYLHTCGYAISYNAIMDNCTNNMVFVEDFEKGNISFLMPYGEYGGCEDINSINEKEIREFFGDKFKDCMISRISVTDRGNLIEQLNQKGD